MRYYHASWRRKMRRSWKAYLTPPSLFLHHPKTKYALSITISMASSKDKPTLNQAHSTNIENLSADFAHKVRLLYKSAPTIAYSDLMKAKLLEHNKLSFFIRVLDGKIVVGNLRAGLDKLWAPFKIVKMEFYKTEIFQVWMENQHQLELILKRKPWIVSQHILQIVPWMDTKETKQLDFNKFFIWVQLLHFPEIFQDREIVENNLIESGCFGPTQLLHLELYPKHNDFAEMTRVKVLMDIKDPIPPGFKLPEPINGIEWIQFAYEFLPIFCFRCSFIGHIQAACNFNDVDFCVEPQVTSTGLKFELYNAKTRIFPKPIAKRPVLETQLSLQIEPRKGHYPFLIRNSFTDGGIYAASKGPNEGGYTQGMQGKGKRPMLMEINTPESNLGTGQHFNGEWMINGNPVNIENQFPDSMVFTTQLLVLQFNTTLPHQAYYDASQVETSTQNNAPLIDLTIQVEGADGQPNQLKRQEVSQGKAAEVDETYVQVQNEAMESYNKEREQRRKTPLNMIREDHENSMSSNGNILSLSGRRKRSQMVKAAGRKQLQPKS